MVDENQTQETADGSDATFCPYCGEQSLEESEDWEIEDGVMRSSRTCSECGGKFDAITEVSGGSRYETHTLQFVPETDGDDTVTGVQAVKRIEGDEDDAGVVAERAELNMMFGGCAEVQGPEWAIQELYDYIILTGDLPEEESGESGDWLPETTD